MRAVPMDRTRWPSALGLVLGTTLLTWNTSTTFALDEPVHTSFALLLTSGIVVLATSRFLPRDGGRSNKGQTYEAIPLTEVGQPHASRETSPVREDVAYPSSLRKLRICVIVLLIALLLRVLTIRSSIVNVACQWTYLEPFILLLIASWDFWTVQRRKVPGRKFANEDTMDETLFDFLEQHLVHQPFVFVITAALITVGGLIALNTTDSPASAVICARSQSRSLQFFQYLGFSLDLVIISCITRLLQQPDGRGPRSVALRFASVGWSLLVSGFVLPVFGLTSYVFTAQDQSWSPTLPHLYYYSAFWYILWAVLAFVSALFMIYHNGLVTTAVIVTFFSILTAATSSAWHDLHPFPSTSLDEAFIGVCLAMLGFVVYFYMGNLLKDKVDGNRSSNFVEAPSLLYATLTAYFVVWIVLWASHKDVVNFHPIDMLIYEAHHHHDAYLNQSLASQTLPAAVSEYKRRHRMYPPPRFDAWYEFATTEDSAIIDDFDSIHDDLLPFFDLSPTEIRQRTWDLISNPWNNVTGISIRGGSASVLPTPNVHPGTRLADELCKQINQFAKHLPDMDLAFNLRSEPRIALPFETSDKAHRMTAELREDRPDNTYSEGRAEQWTSIADDPVEEGPLISSSTASSFFDFSNKICPPQSPARDQRIWSLNKLCIPCTYPHSLGAALQNWSTAADICHQPDLADLHDLFISTDEWKATHSLYPVFSSAKLPGFNDILYPSIWDYLETTRYEPDDDFPDLEFDRKNNTIFWRGPLSTDVSNNSHHWTGMIAQRFFRLANPLPNSGISQSLLLPEPVSSQSGKLEYVPVPASTLAQLLSTDVHFTSFTEECAGRNCETQTAELGPITAAEDFQAHWQYRYLLDLEGRTASTAFLPFLRSRSLPFKAGILRAWYTDRLTPWLHFVPLDVRGQGFWTTLAYFAGLEGEVRGDVVKVGAHARDAERLANHGRDWARKALRPVDMEIYFFRLLLEWGRLTDDRRDELGFDVTEEGGNGA